MKSLTTKVLAEEVSVPIRRGHVLEDALRAMKRKTFPYNLTLKVTQLLMSVIMQSLLLFQVQFLGEEADDGGGPRRVFRSACEGNPIIPL